MKKQFYRLMLLLICPSYVFCQKVPHETREKIIAHAWLTYENNEQTHISNSNKLFVEEIYDSLFRDIAIYRVSASDLDLSGSYKLYIPVLRRTGNIFQVTDIVTFNQLCQKLKFPISNFDRVILYLILSGYYNYNFAHSIVIPVNSKVNEYSYFTSNTIIGGIFVRIDPVNFPKYNLSFKSKKIDLVLTSSIDLYTHIFFSCKFNKDQSIKSITFSLKRQQR